MKSIEQQNHEFELPEWKTAPASLRAEVTVKLEKLMRAIVKIVEPDLFVEVGAFEAASSKEMKSIYPQVTAIAAEANSAVFSHFQDAAIAAGVDYRNVAITAMHGPVEKFVPTRIS